MRRLTKTMAKRMNGTKTTKQLRQRREE